MLLDEHYSPEIARRLRAMGHDVVSVKERKDLIGLPDAEILRHVKGILKGGIFVPLSEFDADEPAKPGYQSKVDKIPAFLIDQDFFEFSENR